MNRYSATDKLLEKIKLYCRYKAKNIELNIEKVFFKKYKLCYKSYRIANNDASWQSPELAKRQTYGVYLGDRVSILS